MGRTRTGLIALACLALAGCGVTVKPGVPESVTSVSEPTTTTESPKVSGYPLPQGKSTELYSSTTSVKVKVGDVIVVQRTREVGQHPDPAVLVPAEADESRGKLIFQAVGPGKVTLYTADPVRAKCTTTPCPPGTSAPPRATIEVEA
ncbi:hypothetical protein [Actinokineospora sp. HUAS TT18]|uniref:hypothetical protein n=1 Tax=Actinokineospora sp. HUAS TT18 TaxID=3447451 RepID=UPI003F5235C8